MESSFSRRTFIQAAGLAGVVGLPSIAHAQTADSPTDVDRRLLTASDEGEVYLIGQRQGRVTIKVSKQTRDVDTMSLLTEEIPPNDRIPVHFHANEEEFIYVSQGSGLFTFGNEEYTVEPGGFVLVPRGVWHGIRNIGDTTIHMVFGYTPAGFEDYFRAIGVAPGESPRNLTPDDWQRINGQFGIVYQ